MRAWCWLLWLPSLAGAQPALLFQKKPSHYVRYYTGEVITFYVHGQRTPIRQQILGFRDSVVVFRHYTLKPSEISHMVVDKKSREFYVMRYKYDKLLLASGLGYLLLEVINNPDGITAETVLLATSLTAAGLLAHVLIPKKIKISGRRKVAIVG